MTDIQTCLACTGQFCLHDAPGAPDFCPGEALSEETIQKVRNKHVLPKLSDCFSSLTDCEDFMTLICDFDNMTASIFSGERVWRLSDWLRIGKKLTDAMRDGSSVPTKYATELAGVNSDIANAASVRDILRAFISASDNDYRLRCAPECFRTRVFRDLARDFGNIVESAAKVNFERMPDFLHGIGDGLRVIIEVASRMQGICRIAKKDMKRHGSRFWAKLDEWNAMRNAV